MARPAVVVTNATSDTPAAGDLFAGLSFFLIQRVPQRSSYISKIQANGGHVVKLEGQADHIIADHVRRDSPPGSLSYTFVDAALRDSAIPDLAAHLAGPPLGAVREVGSSVPGRTTRTAFTAKDDRVLWEWVEKSRAEGWPVKGNEIYKHLEARNSRHSFQSWRERYLKKLMHRPPVEPARPLKPDAMDQNAAEDERPTVEFTDADFDEIYKQTADIQLVPQENVAEAFEAWAAVYAHHTAEEWLSFYQTEVLPEYKRRRAEKHARASRRGRAHGEEEDLGRTKRGMDMIDEAKIVANAKKEAGKTRPDARAVDGRPGNSQKRKRGEPAAATQGRKKHKSDFSDMLGDETEQEQKEREQVTQPPSQAQHSCSEGVRKKMIVPIDMLSDEEDGEDSQVDGSGEEVVAPRSNANSAAQQQLQVESEKREINHLDAVGANDPIDSDLTRIRNSVGPSRIANETAEQEGSASPTSEVNRAADEQLQRESVEDHSKEEDVMDAQLRFSITHSATDDLAQDAFDREVFGYEQGNALTEANLASQQAEHNPERLRAADLTQDDARQDQSEYTQYLQTLVGVTANGPINQMPVEVPERLEKTPSEAEGNAIQLPSNDLPDEPLEQTQYDVSQLLSDSDELVAAKGVELPHSSQQEIDEMFQQNLELPSSPQQGQRDGQAKEPETHGQSFETQVQYPTLAEHFKHGHDAQQSLSQAPQYQQVPTYPDLPQHQARTAQPEVVKSQKSFKTLAGSEPGAAEIDDDYVMVDGGGPEDADVLDDDEIDLSVPEPDGGFGFSSPLAPHSGEDRVQPSQESESQQALQSGVHDVLPEGNTNGTIVIFSDSSSSSSSSSYGSNDDSNQATPSAQINGRAMALDTRAIVDAETQYDDSDQATPRAQIKGRTMALDTQAIVDAETQQPDLDMLLPPDSEDEMSQILSDDLLANPLSVVPQPKRAEIRSTSSTPQPSSPWTHQPPPTRLSSQIPSQHPRPSPAKVSQFSPSRSASRSQRHLNETQRLPQDDVGDYVDTMIVRGFNEATVVEALKCTSLRPELAELVMIELKLKKSVPSDIPGIWTEREDQLLEAGDARALRRLEEKHGSDEFTARLEFLRMWREEE